MLDLLEAKDDALFIHKEDNSFKFKKVLQFKNVSFKYRKNEDFGIEQKV